MPTIRFLHTADLHLDTPFKGLTQFPSDQLKLLRESTFHAFTNFIQYAVETKPDFIVMVGDIYDGEHRSLRAQLKFQEGMEVLNEAQIPVFLSYGNHDHLKGTWTRFKLPENVYVFQEEVEKKTISIRGETVHVYGFSYPERHVTERMIDTYPVAQTDEIHIGLLHGSIAGDTSHAVYAPFTKEALLSKYYHYWALGHIHKRQTLHEDPPIVYAGNLQGRHRHERGAKGFYDVTLNYGQVRRQFVQASSIVFESLSISCEGMYHAGDWLEACKEALKEIQEQYQTSLIVELTMTNIDEKASALFSQSSKEEWLNVLREVMPNNVPFIWVNDLIYEDTKHYQEVYQSMMNPVIETMKNWENDRWEEVLQELYQHTRSMPYLERLTAEDIKEIQAEATEQLLTTLIERR